MPIIIRLTVEREASDKGAPFATSFEEYKCDLSDEVPADELKDIVGIISRIIKGTDNVD